MKIRRNLIWCSGSPRKARLEGERQKRCKQAGLRREVAEAGSARREPVPSGGRARAEVREGSTSRPGAWKAHGAAGARAPARRAGSRWAGLLQAARRAGARAPKAVLKQPSPRGMTSHSLGWRCATPLQSSKLDLASQTASIYRAGMRAATGVACGGWKGNGLPLAGLLTSRSGVRSAGRRRRGVGYRRLWWGSGAPATFLGVGGEAGPRGRSFLSRPG
jgi:hypothetical protein